MLGNCAWSNAFSGHFPFDDVKDQGVTSSRKRSKLVLHNCNFLSDPRIYKSQKPCCLSQRTMSSTRASGVGLAGTTFTFTSSSSSKNADVVGPIAAILALRRTGVFSASLALGMLNCECRIGKTCFAELGAKCTIHQWSVLSGSAVQNEAILVCKRWKRCAHRGPAPRPARSASRLRTATSPASHTPADPLAQNLLRRGCWRARRGSCRRSDRGVSA